MIRRRGTIAAIRSGSNYVHSHILAGVNSKTRLLNIANERVSLKKILANWEETNMVISVIV